MNIIKKTILLILIDVVLVLLSNAQNSLIDIDGIIKGVNMQNGTAFIVPIAVDLDFAGYKFDSLKVKVTNNRFHFSGIMPYPHGFESIWFRSANKNFNISSFFLDSGNINMTCYYDSSQQRFPEINGSKTNDEYQQRFLPDYQPIQNLMNWYLEKKYNDEKKYSDSMPDSISLENQKFRSAILVERNFYLKQYISQNPGSYIPLSLIGQSLARINGNEDETAQTFNFISEPIKNTISGIKIQNIIQQKKISNLNKVIAETRFVDYNNISTPIAFFKNKYTLVDFWFSNCAPCIKQFSLLTTIYKSYKNSGFEIVGISTDENSGVWKNAVSKYKIEWKQLWDKDKLSSSKLLINAFPTNFLLDQNGNIIKKDIESGELENFLKLHLK